ncbi:DUF2341 domain-containing protein [Paenibacillus sp. LMG 31461]|uniref:DUF2341 domain-containing protein n=1 Tax=Paenibacillus plantarum TaxID=2654975 RepID=A0ABX1XN14_9BACL|nr:DUF2341 domain-containing protein [Paenibacillus plantarum]NOU69827.1 DUF2341 domain-containing protein [Paenibacillus plantarum]
MKTGLWKKRIMVILLLALFLQILQPVGVLPTSTANAAVTANWADTDRNYRIKISFDNQAAVEDLQDFPVPVKLDASKINYTVTNQDDLHFFNDDQSVQLPYEVEKWDPQGESIVWVTVPKIRSASSTDHMWLYYGGSSLKTNDQLQAWNSDFLLVYHFGQRIVDNYANPSQVEQFKDSTSNANIGLRQSKSATTSGTAYTLEGADPKYHRVGRYFENSLGTIYPANTTNNGNIGDGEPQITISGWARLAQGKVAGSMLVRENAYWLKAVAGKWMANVFTDATDNNLNGQTASLQLNGGATDYNWTYLSLTYNSSLAGNNLILYRDGVKVAEGRRTGNIKAGSALTIGGSSFKGGIDEARISRTARSASWVQAEYLSMMDTFLIYGEAESQNAALQMTVFQPKEGATYYSPDLTFSGFISQSAVITYRLDGGAPVTISSQSTAFQTTLLSLKSGQHTLTIDAVATSNSQLVVSKRIAFQIDGSKLKPIVSLKGADGEIVDANGKVSLKADVIEPTDDTMDLAFYEKNVQFVSDFQTNSSTNKAYDFTNSMDPPKTDAITVEQPLPDNALKSIQASDSSYYSTQSLKNYPYQRFDMTVEGDLSQIDELEVTWQGHSKQQVMIYAWDFIASKWKQVAMKVGNANNSDFELTAILNTATMVDANKKVKLYVAATQQNTMLPGQKPERDQYDFSFAWMTDTQMEAQDFPDVYDKMTQWVADNKDSKNIQYVVHTGDIVNVATSEPQWVNADRSMKILDDANVRYGVLAGNHDVNSPYTNTSSSQLYYKYFGEDRFKNKPYYGGTDRNNKNHYDLISAGGMDFIIVYMSWGVDQASIDWANDVLSRYKDRKAIVTTHSYLLYDTGNYDTQDFGGQKIMEKVIAPNSNVFMVLCGHRQAAFYNVKRIDGKVVYELLHDYQDTSLGGAAYLRMLYFDVKKQLVYMVPYSTITNDNYGFFQEQYETYTLPLNTDVGDIELATGYIGLKGSKIQQLAAAQPVASGGQSEWEWSGLTTNSTYSWYAEATDSYGNTTKSVEKTFTLKDAPVTSIRLKGLAPMKIGEQRSTVVEATYQNGKVVETTEGYSFTSSNSAVASITGAGVVTAHSRGETIITATNGDVSGSYKLIVQDPSTAGAVMQSLQIDGLKQAMVGDHLQTVVTAVYSDSSSSVLLDANILAPSGLNLFISDETVAMLDRRSGAVTALKAGQTVITATYQQLSTNYTINVRDDSIVTPPQLIKLEITGLNPLKIGEKAKVKLLGTYSDQKLETITEDLQFASSDESIASVDADGLVTAKKQGTVTITTFHHELKATYELTVKAADPGGNSGSSGGGTGGGGGGQSGPIPTDTHLVSEPFVQVIKPDDLHLKNEQGTATIRVEEGKSQVAVPYEVAAQFAGDHLQLVFDWGSANVSMKAIREAGSSLDDENRKKSSLVLTYNSITDELLGGIQSDSSQRTVFLTPVVQVNWQFPTNASSSLQEQSKHFAPIQLSMKVPPQGNAKRAGLYKVYEDGSLEYLSENTAWDKPEAVFNVSNGGSYVVLVYNVKYQDTGGHWAAEVIGDLAARHIFEDIVAEPIVKGRETSQFEPDKRVTRAEFAALLVRAIGLSGSIKNNFDDVPSTAWYSQDVAAAVESGVVQGVSDSSFSPDDLVTREQMAVMLMRAWAIMPEHALLDPRAIQFQDQDEMSSWAKQAIRDAASIGLLNGTGEGQFSPKGNTSRAETVQAIHNYLFGK